MLEETILSMNNNVGIIIPTVFRENMATASTPFQTLWPSSQNNSNKDRIRLRAKCLSRDTKKNIEGKLCNESIRKRRRNL